MKKQTAVEWLVEELTKQNMFMNLFAKEIEQAKTIEKMQHFELYKIGNSFLDSENLNFKDYFEQYYKHTYEK